MEHDCKLTLDTTELEYYLETGEMHRDMDKCFETMLELARKRNGKVVCLFTVHKAENEEAEE
jgi:hypothetical protein